MGDSKKHEEIKDGRSSMTSEELLNKLRKALQKDGDFPASAKIINDLRNLLSNPRTSAQQLADVILREPSLGLRVLNLVNSAFYRRGKPVMTVSQAVVRIGMKPLAEMFASLVLLQNFVPAAREGGAFAYCLKRTIVTSLLTKLLGDFSQPDLDHRISESGFLAGSFSEIGAVLLAFYFPPIYANALKRSEAKEQSIDRSLQELTGLTPLQLSQEILKAVEIPPFYSRVLELCQTPPTDTPEVMTKEEREARRVARDIARSQALSELLCGNSTKETLDGRIEAVRGELTLGVMHRALSDLPHAMSEHCSVLDLVLDPLPAFLPSYGLAGDGRYSMPLNSPAEASPYNLDEIRRIVDNREAVVMVITAVMESLAWSMRFDRVVLLVATPAKTSLKGQMMLGKVENFDPAKLVRPLGVQAKSDAPDAQAFREGRPMFRGEPLFQDGHQITVIPIGGKDRTTGVIYADRVSTAEVELSEEEKSAIKLMSDLLDRSVSTQSR